jgi:hypothetical protein
MSTTDTTYEVADTILAQIGRMNVLAISGGRVNRHPDGVTLPVSNGYVVIVTLDPCDTYTVTRGYRGRIMGQRSDVYCDQVGEVAYRASCFHSYGHDEF